MISGKKLAPRKNHWKVYLLILSGLLYNLHLAFQIHPNPDVKKPGMESPPIFPESSSYFGISPDSLQKNETLTQRIQKL
ncbi:MULTISPECIES: hypothetical protein [Rhodonellum]|uniref:hypothetical protein n=1 Tax=Rhodonellum TaxID=336827 RepID=UPI0003A442BF|nr:MULTISPECIES: hypothetical protein [Rhodonellum]